ncbi:MAG: metalloregulator ArsR/SmtB family transcription factor [Gemmatimonadota bacterium]
MATRLSAIASPVRQRILRTIWDRERSAGEIASDFDITFGAVSQHLGVLRGAGLVRVRKDGRRRHYRADRDAFGPIGPALEAMWKDSLMRLKAVVEDQHGRDVE